MPRQKDGGEAAGTMYQRRPKRRAEHSNEERGRRPNENDRETREEPVGRYREAIRWPAEWLD